MTGGSNRGRVLRWVLLAATGLTAYCLAAHPSIAATLFQKIGQAFFPFFLGLGIAFALNVPLCFLEEKLFAKRKIKRAYSLLLACIFVLGGLAVLLFLILPQLRKSAASLWEKLPGYLTELEGWARDKADGIGGSAAALLEEAIGQLQSGMEPGPQLLRSTMDIAQDTLSGLINAGAGVVFSIYLLARKEALCKACKQVLYAFLPKEWAEKLADVGSLTAVTFRRFASGQLTEALLLGAMCFLGMAVFRMPYALLISVIVGVTALIPIFGAFFGGAAGALILLTERPALALWFLIFLIVLQQFENNFLYPRVVGDSVGLPGIWVLLAVTAGGSLFGAAGMLIGIPAVSVLYTLFRETVRKRLKQQGVRPGGQKEEGQSGRMG